MVTTIKVGILLQTTNNWFFFFIPSCRFILLRTEKSEGTSSKAEHRAFSCVIEDVLRGFLTTYVQRSYGRTSLDAMDVRRKVLWTYVVRAFER